MPPRTKKSASTPAKKSGRLSRTAAKTEAKSDDGINEVVRDEINDNVKVSELDNDVDSSADLNVEPQSQANGSFILTKEDEVKEDEYEKDERLDLEDNEPEYEPEEYGGEYDEKEVDQDDFQEDGDEGMEEVEESDLAEEEEEEEEGDMAEEDIEEVPEELGVEEVDEHADADADEGREHQHHHDHGHDDEHAELFDAAEEREHHELVKERRKRKEFEVFVGGLDKDATEEHLKEVFSVVGEVTEVRLMMNPQTKKNKGFAFLRFSTIEQAKRAVSELKNPVVNGKQCGVTPSQDSDTLFLGNICKTWTKEKLKEKLKLYGIENIEDLTLVEDSNNEGKNRGFAFLEFSSRSEAMDAFKRLQKRDVLLGVERPAKVSFADSFIDPGDEIMAQAKVRARLSRPLQRGKGKNPRVDHNKGGRVAGRRPRAPWNRPLPRPLPPRMRAIGSRPPIVVGRGLKRPVGVRDRRPPPPMPARARPLPPPPRSYERRAPGPPPPKSSLKRDYIRREELPPRSRAVAEYGSRLPPERRPSYRDEYAARSPVYPDVHRSSASRSATRRPYPEDNYPPRYERPPPSYREGRPRDYDSISGSKRPYSAMDDVPSRYTDPGHGMRHSRARVDYDVPSGSSQYADTYGDRMGRSTAGYSGSGSRSSVSAQDSHGLYNSRQGMSYNGSYSGNNDGVYSSSYSSEYASRGSDVGGSSYSSLYSGRGMSGSGYMGGGSSGSYY
ncbi:uncharacterized protein [Spinacia oleracea]|uniref:Uncharacterized protein isoform X2 n=1 Tax=Spinacia oleracea TaxID=3562 RepID=A0ABM3RCE4_SPIOL|nr:uncharacterized protein LOC110806224 isoform X2 [Spinacia oleracea]